MLWPASRLEAAGTVSTLLKKETNGWMMDACVRFASAINQLEMSLFFFLLWLQCWCDCLMTALGLNVCWTCVTRLIYAAPPHTHTRTKPLTANYWFLLRSRFIAAHCFIITTSRKSEAQIYLMISPSPHLSAGVGGAAWYGCAWFRI